jgi:hypothetical protein
VGRLVELHWWFEQLWNAPNQMPTRPRLPTPTRHPRGADYETPRTVANAVPASVLSLRGIPCTAGRVMLRAGGDSLTVTDQTAGRNNQGDRRGSGSSSGSEGDSPEDGETEGGDGDGGAFGSPVGADNRGGSPAPASAQPDDIALARKARAKFDQFRRRHALGGDGDEGAAAAAGGKGSGKKRKAGAEEGKSGDAAGSSDQKRPKLTLKKVAPAKTPGSSGKAGGSSSKTAPGSSGSAAPGGSQAGGYKSATAKQQAEADRAWAAGEEVCVPQPDPLVSCVGGRLQGPGFKVAVNA